jgi:antitoxin MazE
MRSTINTLHPHETWSTVTALALCAALSQSCAWVVVYQDILPVLAGFGHALDTTPASGYTWDSLKEGEPMVTKVQSWGNSQGLRINKQLLEEAHISVGDEVDVTVREGSLVITPVLQTRGKYKLEDLLASIPEGETIEEVDWGPRVGKEAL